MDKVFPHLNQRDTDEERKMLGLPPIGNFIHFPTYNLEPEDEKKKEEDEDSPAKRLKKIDATKKFYADEVGFSLHLDER